MQSNEVILNFLGAIGAAFQQMDDLAHSSLNRPPWSNLMDIDSVPDEGLTWFGQLVGTVVNPSLTPDQQRQQIRDRVGWQRGTVAAITSSVRNLLTGTQTVIISERDTGAYHFHISTYNNETPDQNKVLLAIIANKPAGVQFTYTILGGSPPTAGTYFNLFNDYANYANVFSFEQTYQDVFQNP